MPKNNIGRPYLPDHQEYESGLPNICISPEKFSYHDIGGRYQTWPTTIKEVYEWK